MNPTDILADPATAAFLSGIDSLVPALDTEATVLDATPGFPDAAFASLRAQGAVAAPLPRDAGGLGLGTEPRAALATLHLLRLLGRGSLSVGRVFEGHVNALRLAFRYGSPALREAVARDARDGHLFAIWVTEADAPVRLRRTAEGHELSGEKMFCSGACHVTRPLITAEPEAGRDPRMLIVPLGADRSTTPTLGGLHGMRSAETGACDFTGIAVDVAMFVGEPGDYLRQPEFSAGAWRGIAVALGGVDRLVDELRAQLSERGRDANPAQLARIGEALIARETAAMWARRAALLAEGAIPAEPDDVANTVNLARIAAESAALDVIRLVQRGLGLAAFRQANPVERIFRDLATYLRQPAPDETLAEGARHFTRRDLPQEWPDERPA